ncbi:hypothetical protein SAMN05444397_10156 [Flavobacterium aquidurense]|uniref:Uncharacterized protein n=1 Tax=Flavobacterium frigidimaris TaxID=262320 RepID=A0ABX4BLS3_FLAFR|nr:hypothetical protein [Flavobacterium frigidimaris]OXA76353.1 hypothetical protein B0A65_19325 [Flavobacterium frigidimaris]SDY21294.1 hypothetical protein SAMN05444397_10156 [Flavobacterium aquidurense]
MKPQIRILIYSILFFLYLSSTPLLLTVGEKLKTDPFITLGCGFALLNIVYTFFALKWSVLLNLLCSVVIAALALFLALQFTNLHLFLNYDPYQVKTAILTNAVLSIIFWEIVYQVKIRTNKKTL